MARNAGLHDNINYFEKAVQFSQFTSTDLLHEGRVFALPHANIEAQQHLRARIGCPRLHCSRILA